LNSPNIREFEYKFELGEFFPTPGLNKKNNLESSNTGTENPGVHRSLAPHCLRSSMLAWLVLEMILGSKKVENHLETLIHALQKQGSREYLQYVKIVVVTVKIVVNTS
jgi:hypothetical protein